MAPLTTQHRKSPEFIEYVLRICVVVGLTGMFVVMWPERILRTPIAMIPLWDWFWALVSAVLGGLTVLAAQCVVIETVALLFKVMRHRGSAGETVRASDSESLVPGDE